MRIGITLDEKEASRMVEETITQGFPGMARENLKNCSGKEQEKICNELPELSPETVRYIITTYQRLKKKSSRNSAASWIIINRKEYQKLV